MGQYDKCALTGDICWRTEHREDACSENPSLEDAGICIATLRRQNADLHGELDAMDAWNEKLKAQLETIGIVIP